MPPVKLPPSEARPRARLRARLTSFVALACLSTATSRVCAQAQPVEVSRRELLEQAERAYARGDHVNALRLAQQAGESRMTPSVLLLIAQEHDALGHTLDALAAAERCLRDTEADPAVPQRREILSHAGRLRDSLRARVSYVIVRTPANAPEDLRVVVQGNELDRARWGVAQAALPGAMTVTASSAAGTFDSRVMLDAGRTTTVDVALVARVTSAPPGDAQGATSDVPSWLAARAHGPAPWIVIGVGGALIATAAGLFVARGDAIDNRDAACGAILCTADQLNSARSYDDRASVYGTLADVSLGLGIASVAAGAVWLIVGRRASQTPERAALRWQLAPNRDGLSLGLGGTL